MNALQMGCLAHWPPSRVCSVLFVYDHNGSFDTLHGHRAHSLSLVCHRSEQIGSTRDSVVGRFMSSFSHDLQSTML